MKNKILHIIDDTVFIEVMPTVLASVVDPFMSTVRLRFERQQFMYAYVQLHLIGSQAITG